jgi:hypothetical protein
MHEQIHAMHQETYFPIFGKYLWLFCYTFSPDFMWEAERIGWFAQLKYFRKHNWEQHLAYKKHAANLLSSYTGALGQMISFEDAEQWITDVYNGTWTLPDEDWAWMKEHLPNTYSEIK